jgi:PAS domain S-box-containing protein
MHKLLSRQIKRALGVEEAQSAAVLDELKTLAVSENISPEAVHLLTGLGELFRRVDAAYESSDRDLDLKTRSLELSSGELTQVNTRLREELISRNRAIESLRQTANGLRQSIKDHSPAQIETDGTADDNLESLSVLMAELVQQRETNQRELQTALKLLAHQKFALDQHAIVSITDTEGTIVYANDKFCAISGYAREELIGQNHRIVKSVEHAPELFSNMWETISAAQVWHSEVCNRAKDGSNYWVNATIVPLCDENGLPVQYIAIRTDITQAKRASEELRRAKEGAESANRAKSEFLANMSHEIRTPMNGVIGMTELALDTDLTDEQREYLEIVKSSSDALLTILNDILDFSKIEAGKLLIEHISFNLWRTVGDTLKALALRAHAKGLELISDIAPDAPMFALGDPGRVRQILVNLIGNAVKFTEIGQIVVRVEEIELPAGHEQSVGVHFSIADSGIGIPPAKLDSIFEAFSQEDSSITRQYGGTGLGLTISARLTEMLGGRIWVESEVGRGSTFHFTAVLDRDEQHQAPPTASHLKDRHILLVDDNVVNRLILCSALENSGATVRSAACGSEALLALGAPGDEPSTPFDLIVLDACMPEMDGFETALQILAMPHCESVPLVMLSSGGIKGDAQRCQEIGFAAYLTKPIARDELLLALNRVLDAHNEPQPQLVTRHLIKDEHVPLDVLLVEDHPVNQRLTTKLLERWGHHVTLAVNGQVAVDLSTHKRFDIVLMDRMMPVMDGLEATRRIRAAEKANGTPHTPIVAMTANAMQGDRETCIQAGMDDYLAKPVKSQELRKMIAVYGKDAGSPAHNTENNAATVHHDTEHHGSFFDYAAALQAADREMVDIVAVIFLENYPADLKSMRGALAVGDLDPVLYISHALKGTVAMFGADPARELAHRIEQQAKHGNPLGLDQLLLSLENEIEQLAAALKPLAEAAAG